MSHECTTTHTLLPHLYLYRHTGNMIGYILMDPSTKQLIAIDTGCFETSFQVVHKLEKQHGAKLRYILSTTGLPDHTNGNEKWIEHKRSLGEKLEIITGPLHPQAVAGYPYNVDVMEDMGVKTVGELDIELLDSPGYRREGCSFVVTHNAENGSKAPLLFCGDTLNIGGVGR